MCTDTVQSSRPRLDAGMPSRSQEGAGHCPSPCLRQSLPLWQLTAKSTLDAISPFALFPKSKNAFQNSSSMQSDIMETFKAREIPAHNCFYYVFVCPPPLHTRLFKHTWMRLLWMEESAFGMYSINSCQMNEKGISTHPESSLLWTKCQIPPCNKTESVQHPGHPGVISDRCSTERNSPLLVLYFLYFNSLSLNVKGFRSCK